MIMRAKEKPATVWVDLQTRKMRASALCQLCNKEKWTVRVGLSRIGKRCVQKLVDIARDANVEFDARQLS